MPRPFRRSKLQIERDRVIVGDLYLKGWNQLKIAEYLELNQSQISRELSKIKAIWKQESVRDYDLHVDEQLRRLGIIESECWEGWHKSQQLKEQNLQEKLGEIANGGDSKAKIQRRTETRVGDPKFLETLIRCCQERSRLLDLYQDNKPNKLTNTEGSSIEMMNPVKVYLPANGRDSESESIELNSN